MIAVEQHRSRAVSLQDFEGEEPRLGVEQIADPLGALVARAAAGHKETARHRLAVREGESGPRTGFLDPEIRWSGPGVHALKYRPRYTPPRQSGVSPFLPDP